MKLFINFAFILMVFLCFFSIQIFGETITSAQTVAQLNPQPQSQLQPQNQIENQPQPQPQPLNQMPAYKQVQALALKHQYKEAIDLGLSYLKQHPDDYDVHLMLGLIYSWEKNYELARKHLYLVLNNKPNYLDARIALIHVEDWTQNYQKALQLTDEGLKLSPNNAALLHEKSKILKLINNQKQTVISAFKIQVQPQATSLTPVMQQSSIYQEVRKLALNHRYNEAIELGEAYLKLNPDEYDVHMMVGIVYSWEKNYDLARAHLNLVVSKRPNYLDARMALIHVEVWTKNYQKALQLAEEGLKLNPNNTLLLNEKSLVLRLLYSQIQAKIKTFIPQVQAAPITTPITVIPQQIPIYKQIREIALKHQYQEAINLGLNYLKTHPEDYDVHMIVGIVYSWNKNYEAARTHLNLVVNKKRGYLDARVALIHVELWTKNYQKALDLANAGLKLKPNNALLYEKAVALTRLKKYSPAKVILRQLLKSEPRNKQYLKLKTDIHTLEAPKKKEEEKKPEPPKKEERKKDLLSYDGIANYVDPLDQGWYYTSLSYTHYTPIGSIIPRINSASRLHRKATQYEIDTYPQLTKKFYMNLSYAYSGDLLFPRNRYTVEGYYNLSKTFEISFGEQKLQYIRTNVTFVTGSLTGYFGKNMLTIRPIEFIPKPKGPKTFTVNVNFRHYFNNDYNYIGVILGTGTAPDLADFNVVNFFKIEASRAILYGQVQLTPFLLVRLGLNIERDVFPKGRLRYISGGQGGISFILGK